MKVPRSRDSIGSTSSRFASLETKFDSFVDSTKTQFTELNAALQRFADNVDRRFSQVETEQQAAIQKLNDEQRMYGKPNWAALGVLATVFGAVALLYVGPIKDRQIADEQQDSAQSIKQEARNIRDMTDLRDFAIDQAKGVRDQLTSRMDVEDQRINDVTQRVDRRSDQDRSDLEEYRRGAIENRPVPK